MAVRGCYLEHMVSHFDMVLMPRIVHVDPKDCMSNGYVAVKQGGYGLVVIPS